MVRLEEIKLGYDNKPVLTLDKLAINQGEECLIIGPSGCGKTTLLYAISGLIKPISGKVEIDKTDVTKLSESQIDKFRGINIGIIFQNLHLVKSLNILDNLLLSLYLNDLNQDKKEALQILDDLGIANLAHKFPYQISQGQAQRVAIARAILHKPKLILADEPTSGLDDKNCAAVIKLLKKAASKNNSTLIISTHDNRIKSEFSKQINLGA